MTNQPGTAPTAPSDASAPSTFSLLKGNFFVLFGGVFLVAGLLMAVIGAGMALQQGRYDAEGSAVEATVLGKSIDPGDADEGTRYFVQYRFTDPVGAAVDGRDQVSFEVYDAAREGGPIQVEFIAGDPSTNRVAGGEGFLPWIFVGAGVLGLAIGAAAALHGWRGFSRERRLWRVGTTAAAEVVAVEATNVQVNRRQMFRIRYRFTDASGATQEGRSRYLPFSEVSALRAGDRGTVRYDPQRPAESTWVGGAPAGP